VVVWLTISSHFLWLALLRESQIHTTANELPKDNRPVWEGSSWLRLQHCSVTIAWSRGSYPNQASRAPMNSACVSEREWGGRVERLYAWRCSAGGARAGRSPPRRDQLMPQVFGGLARRCRLVICTTVVLNQMAVRITPGPVRSWQKSNGLLPGFGASRRKQRTVAFRWHVSHSPTLIVLFRWIKVALPKQAQPPVCT
jgi:hypothetical protein